MKVINNKMNKLLIYNYLSNWQDNYPYSKTYQFGFPKVFFFHMQVYKYVFTQPLHQRQEKTQSQFFSRIIPL